MESIKFTGSEKQVEWANSIISGALAILDKNIETLNARKEETGWSGYDADIAAYQQVKTDYVAFAAKLDGTDASRIIDNRYKLNAQATEKMVDQARRQLASK